MQSALLDLRDTPDFKLGCEEVLADLSKHEAALKVLLAASLKYSNAVSAAFSAEQDFASALGQYSSSSASATNSSLQHSASLHSELAGVREMLAVQVDILLHRQLEASFGGGSLSRDVKEAKRAMDKAGSDEEAACLKFFALRSSTSKPQALVDKARADLDTSRAIATETRFDFARKAQEAQSRARYQVADALSETANAQAAHFKMGNELLTRSMPGIARTMAWVEHAKREGAAGRDALEAAMQVYTATEAARSDEVNRVGRLAVGSATSSSTGPLNIGSAEKETVQLQATVLRQLAAQPASGDPELIKGGWLLRKSTGLRGDWKREYFIADSRGMLSVADGKEGLAAGLQRRVAPSLDGRGGGAVGQTSVNLRTATIKQQLDDPQHGRFVFQVVSPGRSYLLQAESLLERAEWITVLGTLIAAVLGSPADAGVFPPPSRTSSVSSLGDADRTPVESGGAFSRLGSQAPPDPDPSGSGAAGQGAGASAAPPPPPVAPLSVLRAVDGNETCADCGAPDPEWASLNLGILVCIQCSSMHRRLGVHISKVRSTVLDIAAWSDPVLELCRCLGNDACNAVMEARPGGPDATGTPTDAWVWCDSSDEDAGSEEHLPEGYSPTKAQREPLTARPRRRRSEAVQPSAELAQKPGPSSSLQEKSDYIRAKYESKAFLERGVFAEPLSPDAQAELWRALAASDFPSLLRGAVSSPGVLTAVLSTPPALRLMEDAAERCRRRGASPPREAPTPGAGCPVAEPGCSLAHLAASDGHLTAIEFLYWHRGDALTVTDSHRRTPLHYCVAFGQWEAAKLLLRRGVDCQAVDEAGRTAMDIAVDQGRVEDEELFVSLCGGA